MVHDRSPSPLTFICINAECTMSILDTDPQSTIEAFQSVDAEKWKQAMEEEYHSLIKNNTWTLVDIPKNKTIIPCKWVYKTKTDENDIIARYKARLVIKGYKQTKRVDYHETYAPVVRYSSIRYLIGVAAKYNMKIHQLDAISVFSQGEIEEETFMS